MLRGEIQDKLKQFDHYNGISSFGIDTKEMIVVVEFVENDEEHQKWFKDNISDSEYIKFRQGGPYTTSSNIRIEVVKNTPNELIEHIKKYLSEYPYEQSTIAERKKNLINSSNKEYVVIFLLDDYKKELIPTIRSLNIDFKVMNDAVFINSFYFSGLENVLETLKLNTEIMQ